jgi:murein DD-endopeptidase
MKKQRIRFLGDTLGLAPLPLRLKQALVTIRGEADVPSSRWGLSSLSQLYPKVSLKLWRGKSFVEKKVIISNLFNHTQTDIEAGWSVRKTQTLDFRGRGLTYDSHNGTDFAIPIGTTVCTAAAGKVVQVVSEFNRGGLKIFIDHGEGLMTCYAHLAKSLVQVGDRLHRGQAIAISGYSGLDGAVTFPFGIPHVHFNVWLNGLPIDPFAHAEQISLWLNGELPSAASDCAADFTASEYNADFVKTALENCKTHTVKERILKLETLEEQAVQLIIEMNYYPTRFTKNISVYRTSYARKPILDLPFSGDDFNGVVFLDDVLNSLRFPIKRNFRSRTVQK